MQYIRIHLTNYLQDFNAENYKITDEKVNEDQNKWRNILCLWMTKFDIVIR